MLSNPTAITQGRPDVDHAFLQATRTRPFKPTCPRFRSWQEIKFSLWVKGVKAAASVQHNLSTGCAAEEDPQNFGRRSGELRQCNLTSDKRAMQAIRYAPGEPAVAAKVV